jgi:hypothetical protein
MISLIAKHFKTSAPQNDIAAAESSVWVGHCADDNVDDNVDDDSVNSTPTPPNSSSGSFTGAESFLNDDHAKSAFDVIAGLVSLDTSGHGIIFNTYTPLERIFIAEVKICVFPGTIFSPFYREKFINFILEPLKALLDDPDLQTKMKAIKDWNINCWISLLV